MTPDNKIVFGLPRDGLRAVSAAGGASSVPLTTVDRSRGETSHFSPSLLPDGRHFLYTRGSTQAENSGIYLGSLDAKPEAQSAKRLLAGVLGAIYAPSPDGSAYLLFVRSGGTLMAQPFDVRKLEPAGEAVPIAEKVGGYSFSPSANGVLVYQAGFINGAALTNPTLFDRNRNVVATVAETARYFDAALSPDGKWVAGSRADPSGIWLYEFASGNSHRFTFGRGGGISPVWSPDGSQIAFAPAGRFLGEPETLYQKASNMKGDEVVLFQKPGGQLLPSSWNGRFLLLNGPSEDPKKQWDVWVLPMERPYKPILLSSTDNQQDATFSPDGKWIAYTSDASGRVDEIYVRPFDPASLGKPSGELHLVSSGGGTGARWRGDELFYTAPDGNVMSVKVATAQEFNNGAATPVFKLPANATLQDVSADGQALPGSRPGRRKPAPPGRAL